MKPWTLRLQLLFTTLLPLAGIASPALASTLYTVELVIFADLHSHGLDAETWPDNPGHATSEGSIQLGENVDLSGTDTFGSAEVATPQAFRLLGPGAYRMKGVVQQLKRSAQYRPLLHIAWQQPGFSKNGARPVHVRSYLENPKADRYPSPPLVDGIVRVYKAGRLHVEVDLVYYRAPPPQRPETRRKTRFPLGTGNTVPPASHYPDTSGTTTLFRMKEHRRLGLREIHYFDHPLFGMLMQVTPYEAPKPATPAVDALSSERTSPAQTSPNSTQPSTDAR